LNNLTVNPEKFFESPPPENYFNAKLLTKILINPAKRNGSIFQNEASAFSEKAQNETSNKKRNTQHV